MARIKEKQGIKNCPTCTTILVKDEGCNHVTCAMCDTHMCWKCLEVSTGINAMDRVYRHLNAEHGRIDDYPPGASTTSVALSRILTSSSPVSFTLA